MRLHRSAALCGLVAGLLAGFYVLIPLLQSWGW
jgi:hypothetical protein